MKTKSDAYMKYLTAQINPHNVHTLVSQFIMLFIRYPNSNGVSLSSSIRLKTISVRPTLMHYMWTVLICLLLAISPSMHFSDGNFNYQSSSHQLLIMIKYIGRCHNFAWVQLWIRKQCIDVWTLNQMMVIPIWLYGAWWYVYCMVKGKEPITKTNNVCLF